MTSRHIGRYGRRGMMVRRGGECRVGLTFAAHLRHTRTMAPSARGRRARSLDLSGNECAVGCKRVSGGLKVGQGSTDEALTVHLHEFRPSLSPSLEMHDDAFHALVDTEELNAEISGKGRQADESRQACSPRSPMVPQLAGAIDVICLQAVNRDRPGLPFSAKPRHLPHRPPYGRPPTTTDFRHCDESEIDPRLACDGRIHILQMRFEVRASPMSCATRVAGPGQLVSAAPPASPALPARRGCRCHRDAAADSLRRGSLREATSLRR